MHCWQERDLSVLPREGRSQENVSNPLGKAAHDVRPVAGLVALVSVLAANNSCYGPRHKLDTWTRIVF